MTAIAIPARQRHVLAFGKPLGLTHEQIDATVVGDSGDPAWSDRDALQIQLCDELYEIRWLLQMCGRLSDKQLQDSIDIGITQTLKKPSWRESGSRSSSPAASCAPSISRSWGAALRRAVTRAANSLLVTSAVAS